MDSIFHLTGVLGALVNLNGNGHYVHWGFIQISVANLIVISLMIVVFVAALLIPFPKRHGRTDHDGGEK